MPPKTVAYQSDIIEGRQKWQIKVAMKKGHLHELRIAPLKKTHVNGGKGLKFPL